MGIQSRFVAAKPDDGPRIAASDEPSDEWDCGVINGLCHIKLASLFAVLGGDGSDQMRDQTADRIVETTNRKKGPWVFSIPNDLRDRYAEIAAMDDDEVNRAADQWAATPELEGWDPEDVRASVREIGDIAETASLSDLALWLWMSH